MDASVVHSQTEPAPAEAAARAVSAPRPRRAPVHLRVILAAKANPRTPHGAPPCASFLPRSGSRGTTQPCPGTPASSPEQPATTSSNSRVDDANSWNLPSAPSRAGLAAGTMGARMTCSPRIHLLSRGPDAAMSVLALDPLRPAPSPTSSQTQQVRTRHIRHGCSLSLIVSVCEEEDTRFVSICRTPLLIYN